METVIQKTRGEVAGRTPKVQKVKLGVAGCGGHALDGHLAPLAGDGTVCAAFDPNPGAMDLADRTIGRHLKHHPSFESLLNEEINALFIASPDKYHAEALAKAVAAGKHVLIEKPLATNEAELVLLMDSLATAKEKKLIISSCHPRRFDPPFLWLKEQLPGWTARFGRVLRFQFDFSYHEPSQAWKTNRSLLLDHANHEIDLVHFLFGCAETSASKISDSYNRYEVTGQRADGISFDFNGSRLLHEWVYHEMAAIRYAGASVCCYPDLGKVTIFEHGSGKFEEMSCPKTDYAGRGASVTQNFFAAIRGEEPCYLSPSDLVLNTSFCISLLDHGKWASNEALLA